MAKRASRTVLPPRKSGNPNVAIIIFLVFSLLGNIALGVFFYLGQEKIAAAEKKAKESDDKLKKQTTDSLLVKDYYIARLRALLDPKSGVSEEEFKRMMNLRAERVDALAGGKATQSPDDVWLENLTTRVEAMIGSLESGTATDNSGERSLQDASKNWPKDLWKDKRVRISDGSGKDEINVIQSNTNDTLVFAQAWQKRPDKSSKYDIIDFYEKDTTPDTAPSIHKILEAKARIIATLDAELKLTKTELAAVKAALAKHEADWNQGKFDTLFNKQFKDLEDGYKGRIAKAEEKAIDAQKQFDVKNKELNDFIQTNALKEKDLTAKHETEKKGWEKERQELKLSVASGGGTAGDPKVKMGASDEINEPRGNIVRAEANGETVIIDLGSDHKVVAQLTFAVHGMGTGGKPLRDPKAKIEVISVLSKDQSLARVTRMYKPENARDTDNPENEKNWIKDPRDFWRVRNPILKGDVIYNPAWRPNRKVHIALNGVFDLDGDGKEDFATLRKLLEERGAVIDAWLDPEGGKYDKRGELTAKTEFVVVGVRPPMILNPREGEPKPEFKDGFEKLEREAIGRAIEPITLKRFLERMGYTDLSLPSGKGGLGAPIDPEKKDPKDPKDPPKDMPKK